MLVPDLRTNLLSVSKITDRGSTVIFDKKEARIVDKYGFTQLRAIRENGLYYLTEEQERCKTATNLRKNQKKYWSSMESWHSRMGHLNIKDLLKGRQSEVISGIKIKNFEKMSKCEVCIRGKMTQKPFPKKSERKTELLESIDSDICEPMRTESLGKARYFVTFIDNFSRWCVIKTIRNKNEVFQAFKEFKIFVERQTGGNIKSIHTDNGREYLNREFDEFLKKNGIAHRLTVTHTPQQNGIAERKNRTLVEMARCLLIQSNLSPSFWGEAINTANYIRNRCPTNSLNGKTPFEMWTGKIPYVGYFREFGCPVYSLNREPNKKKFEERSKKGIFDGDRKSVV